MRNRADKKLQTDGRTDRPTDKLTPIYPPNRVLGGIISPKLAEAVGYKNFTLRLKSDVVPTVFDFKNRRNGELKGRNSEKSIAKKKVQHEVLVCRFRFNF